MGEGILECSNTEKDIGVMVENHLRTSSQCDAVTNMANTILGHISRGISSRSKKVVLPMHMVLVRPVLDTVCSSDIQLLMLKNSKGFRKRAIKMIQGVDKPYIGRFNKLNLFNLFKG